MNNIFFISDTHFGHKNIVKGISSWADKSQCRDFPSLRAHDDVIIRSINNVVMPHDTLYHLGDFSFGGIGNIWEFRKRIRCENIHLILGNHDHHIKKNKEIRITWEDYWGRYAELNIRAYTRSHISEEGGFRLVPVREIFSSVQTYLELDINGMFICMSHYPIYSWNRASKGAFMVHGHTHGALNSSDLHKRKIIDVGVESIHENFGHWGPVHLSDLAEFMAGKTIEIVDHHTGSELTPR